MARMIFFVLLAAIVAAGWPALISAGDNPPSFANSAEEIKKILSAPSKPKIGSRSMKIGTSKPPSRIIRVMANEGGQAVCKDVVVSADQTAQPGVNLKVEFDVASHAIRPESFGTLTELAHALQSEALKARAVVIRGHTDSDGGAEQNLALSLRRAEAVKAYLTAGFRIAADRIWVEGWGEAQPLAPNDSEANKQLNRRVEIVCRP